MFGRGKRAGRTTGSSGGADYTMVVNRDGEVLGVWTRDERLARDMALIDAILAKHELWDQLELGRSVVPNSLDDRGGMLVLFNR